MPRRRATTKANGVAQKEEKAAEVEQPSKAEPIKESAEPEKPEPEEVDNDQTNNDNAEASAKSEPEEKNNEGGEASGDEENAEDDDKDDENEEGKDDKAPANNSLYIKILGFKKISNLEEDLKLYYRFFTEAIGIQAPKVQIPGPDDRWIYFELHSLEDRSKLFEELKSKGYTWEGFKLNIESVVIKTPEEGKELKRLPVEEAIKILFPLVDVPYAQQLKDKATRAKDMVDDIIPRDTLSKYTKSKKYVTNLRVKDVVPMFPIEGHEYNATFHIEEDPETGETLYGLRALSEDKESIGIVPIDQCVNIPLQMKHLVKSFVAQLPVVGLRPYNYTKKEGDIMGIVIQMTLSARFVMTVIIPKMHKIIVCAFKQLTEDGIEKVEGEEDGPHKNESYSAMVKRTTQEVESKLEKYFNEEGKKYSLESVYLHSSFPNKLKEESSLVAKHILGLSFVPDSLNGILHRLTGERSHLPIDALRPILGLIEAYADINSSTRVYLASPFRLVGLYFAKKCAHVTMFFSWTRENLHELKHWANMLNVYNIEFSNAKSHTRKVFPAENSVAIFWLFTKPTLANRLMISGVTNVITISHWNKLSSPSQSFVEQQKKQLETIYSKLKISHIYPVDLAPFTERIGLAIFFNGLIPVPTQNFRRDLPAPMPLLGPGPVRGGPGPYGDRPGPWQRPDPWGPPGRSQLDQVASGMMQNLQAVQQQMQAFIPSLMESAPTRPPPANPSWNKRNWDNSSGDSWGYGGKRRRDDKGEWKKNYGKGRARN